IQQCQEKENNQTVPRHPDECIKLDNHLNSILALDLDSGKIRWHRQLGGYDVWFFVCSSSLSTPDCPPGPSPDTDLVWALDRDNGNVLWSTEAGPGGPVGGVWGGATDNKRVYTNIANSDRKNFTLRPSKLVTTAGGWVAMEAKTGKILWSTADPSNATALGPVTVANGVVFAGSTHLKGPIYAINARSGKVTWSYETRATVYGGISVSNGCIYVMLVMGIASVWVVSFFTLVEPPYLPFASLDMHAISKRIM
ncbi:PQQ-dependent membrane bound dehydrogenase, glucose/quinate/shikimate-related, partial [Parasponia andersonii]